jgi:hypothetical protein
MNIKPADPKRIAELTAELGKGAADVAEAELNVTADQRAERRQAGSK